MGHFVTFQLSLLSTRARSCSHQTHKGRYFQLFKCILFINKYLKFNINYYRVYLQSFFIKFNLQSVIKKYSLKTIQALRSSVSLTFSLSLSLSLADSLSLYLSLGCWQLTACCACCTIYMYM